MPPLFMTFKRWNGKRTASIREKEKKWGAKTAAAIFRLPPPIFTSWSWWLAPLNDVGIFCWRRHRWRTTPRHYERESWDKRRKPKPPHQEGFSAAFHYSHWEKAMPCHYADRRHHIKPQSAVVPRDILPMRRREERPGMRDAASYMHEWRHNVTQH